ncbi:MAG: hypothetical protein PHO66_00750, partial [Eubacteriales bacterium]|nr:hypothetical protein [Eubacteriales bacterium]
TQASRQAMNLLKGGEKETAAAQWFSAHGAEALPGLMKLLDSPRQERVEAGQKALISLGQDAIDYINANFHSLTARQQQNAVGVVAATVNRERVMLLLFLMSYPDARPTILTAFAGLGQDAADIPISLLQNPQLKSQVKDAFAALDAQVAAAALIPLLESTNATQAAQAQSMLLELGDSAASALIDYALHTERLSDSIRALLIQNPDTTIAGIAAHSCQQEGCPAAAAGLLQALGDDAIAQAYLALAHGSDQAAAVAGAYSQAIGVDKAVGAVLDGNITDSTVLALVAGGFSDAASQEALAKYMLRSYEQPNVESSCSALLIDTRARQAFDALTASGGDALRSLLSTYSDGDLA